MNKQKLINAASIAAGIVGIISLFLPKTIELPFIPAGASYTIESTHSIVNNGDTLKKWTEIKKYQGKEEVYSTSDTTVR